MLEAPGGRTAEGSCAGPRAQCFGITDYVEL